MPKQTALHTGFFVFWGGGGLNQEAHIFDCKPFDCQWVSSDLTSSLAVASLRRQRGHVRLQPNIAILTLPWASTSPKWYERTIEHVCDYSGAGWASTRGCTSPAAQDLVRTRCVCAGLGKLAWGREKVAGEQSRRRSGPGRGLGPSLGNLSQILTLAPTWLVLCGLLRIVPTKSGVWVVP